MVGTSNKLLARKLVQPGGHSEVGADFLRCVRATSRRRKQMHADVRRPTDRAAGDRDSDSIAWLAEVRTRCGHRLARRRRSPRTPRRRR